MEHICEEQTDELDDQTIKQLVNFGVEEMIRCSEYLPSIQLSISNMLVAMGQKNCTLVRFILEIIILTTVILCL